MSGCVILTVYGYVLYHAPIGDRHQLEHDELYDDHGGSQMIDLKNHKNIHCIGIGGIGVSALAKILVSRGYNVTGSDMKESEMTDELEKLGIKVFIGHRAENVEGADLIIYSAAIAPENPEIKRAMELGIELASRAELLGTLMDEFKTSIAVSGTHGKTTTTSMVSLILEHADYKPTIFVGGNLDEIGGNVKVDTGDYFVAEACEYRDSFIKHRTDIEIILNIDSDHLDYFKDIEHIVESFGKFVSYVPDDGLIIDIDLLERYANEEIVLVTTGSQGEPMSALSRMASSEHRKVEVGPGDFIIISANPIPGNEKMVSKIVNDLMKHGCKVVYESMYEVHVSGHACQEELKLIQGLTKPKYFIPVHGEQKHLVKHAELAVSMGIPRKNIFIGDIGNVVELNKERIRQLPSIPAGNVLVDGLGVGDVGSIVLRDRKHLGQDGLIVVVVTLDSHDRHIIAGPDVVSRGFVYVKESEPLMDEAKDVVTETLDDCRFQGVYDWSVIKTAIKDDLSKMIYDKTRRSPMILPVIMEV